MQDHVENYLCMGGAEAAHGSLLAKLTFGSHQVTVRSAKRV